ncbi:MAG: adenylate/guanylate cyclase with Chase sensor [Verrucomicrobia bacterium]|nr:adenylate/guanylate cyclase with Chase sensor [Verrucomicrobiota bacterium]
MARKKPIVVLSPLRWLVLLLIPAVWCGLANLGLLNALEGKLLDLRYRERGEIDAPIKIVYVDIDAHSLDELGAWPWSRTAFAKVASTLISQGGASAIGIDMVFSDRDVTDPAKLRKLADGNVDLSKYLATDPPLVLAASYSAVQFRDFGTPRTTLLELPMVIFRTISRSFNSSPAAPVAAPRRNSHAVPLLGNEPSPGLQFEPPEVSALYVGKKELWEPTRIGLIDTVDGDARWVPAYIPTVTRTFRSMAIELALAYWGLTGDAVKTFDDRLDIVRTDGRRMASIPLRDRQLIEVNWFSAWNSPVRNPRFGFATVLKHAESIDGTRKGDKSSAQQFFSQPIFKDAIVLIGPVDPLLHDTAPTPLDEEPVPKVAVQGNLLKMIFSGQYVRRLPPWGEYSLLFLLTFVVSRMATEGGTKGARYKLTAALILTAYVWFAFWFFRHSSWVIPLGATLGSVFTTSFAAIIWQLIREERQKRRIKGMFGTYVSPQLVQRMIDSGESPQLGGHKQDLTAYFSDIESFSKFSEILDSGRLVELMNEYLTASTDILEEESGTLDKYIGDAVMAMFGAPVPLPDHSYRACVASQRVHQRIAELREKWKSEGDKWPDIVWRMQTRIGLNSGPATVGNLGSRSRLNYTVMGDNINLAARMESGAKHYGVRTMVTEATKLGCERIGGDHVVFRYLDRIIVKGRSFPVPIFEIVGLKENVTSVMRECLEWFDRGMERYLAQDWDGAAACFVRSEPLESNRPGETPGVQTNPSLVFLERCTQMKKQPPGADWNGTYTMTEK